MNTLTHSKKNPFHITPLINLLTTIFEKGSLIQAVLSGHRRPKIEVRPVMQFYQVTKQVGPQVFHQNLGSQECLEWLIATIPDYKQTFLFTSEGDFHLLTNKKGEMKILPKKASKKLETVQHNQPKNYLLAEGTALPFLVELGIMNAQGKVYPQKMAKFRQINRFLEMVDDVIDPSTVHVIDFGCGKAYLTFALYYYLKVIKGFKVKMHGLDLKKEVISFCSQLARKLEYDDLTFSVGEIGAYIPQEGVDLVVALHACDTATDAAIDQAIKWKAKTIVAAPCCQHELFKQVRAPDLHGILQYGLLKERFSALATDPARALVLEIKGYTTQILEFVDPDDTPKNILIRATLGNSEIKRVQAKNDFLALKKFLNIFPKIENTL